jgi:hypothetical protein
VIADPVRPDHLRARHAAVVAGGPAAHLLFAVGLLTSTNVGGGAPGVAAVMLLIIAGWNLMPQGLRRQGLWLDGDWLLAWSIRPLQATQRLVLATISHGTDAGERPREWDERWIPFVEQGIRRPSTTIEVYYNLLGYTTLLDRGRIDDAGRLLAWAFAGRKHLSAEQCAAVLVEAAFFVARHRRRIALAAKMLINSPQPSSGMAAADLERARAAIHLAAGNQVEAVAACNRALAILDRIDDQPIGLLAFDRDQVNAIHSDALRPAVR